MRITEENKQSRLRQYISAPKRFLRRARDFYVDSLVTFDGKVARASANIVVCPVTATQHLAKKFSDENREEMYRTMSKKFDKWSSLEDDKLKERVNIYGGIDRSYSVALGKIGTIDEEEPCEFQEYVVIKSEILFPRSRSHAVTRNYGF